MRILITGSRDWGCSAEETMEIYDALRDVVVEFQDNSVTVVVHGNAPGADAIAGMAAEQYGFTVETHPADWETHGRKAGFVRNAEMVKLGADICLAFIMNESKGATMTADLAEKSGIPVRRYIRGDN